MGASGQRNLLRLVLGHEARSERLGFEATVDTLYAIGSPEIYRVLVADRAWSAPQFERWYGDTLTRLLLDHRGGGPVPE
jgi:hypothetical protein